MAATLDDILAELKGLRADLALMRVSDLDIVAFKRLIDGEVVTLKGAGSKPEGDSPRREPTLEEIRAARAEVEVNRPVVETNGPVTFQPIAGGPPITLKASGSDV